jgi:hypothetical protein
MSYKIFQLSVRSRVLSQPEKKNTVMYYIQAEKIDKLHSKWSLVKKVSILSENSCHFVS